MNVSKTQLMNYATMLTNIVMLGFTTFGVEADQQHVLYIVFAVLSLGFSAYNFYQRFQKGDINLNGSRK